MLAFVAGATWHRTAFFGDAVKDRPDTDNNAAIPQLLSTGDLLQFCHKTRMGLNAGWGRRLRDAKRDYEKRHDVRLTYREIGERVAALIGRETPFSPTSARDWFERGQEPDTFAVAVALAHVLEVTDAGTLVVGQGSPPAIPLVEAPLRRVSKRARKPAAELDVTPPATKRGKGK